MKIIVPIFLFTVIISFTSNAQIKAECISGNCVNGRGIYKNSNGSIYEGDFVDSIKNGTGTLVWTNGDKYIGDFKAGYRTGKGKYYFSDGRIYEGDFNAGKFEGIGTMNYKDGSKYIGNWKADQITGKGKIDYATGGSYEGDFFNNTLEGKGTRIYKDSSIYSGDWKANNRHGKGKYIYANGKIEEGDFENDQFINPMDKPWTCISGDCYKGFGTKNFEYGSTTSYTGQFKDGQPNGEGTLKEFDNIYKGQFKNGYKNGIGTFTQKNGSTYTGKWKDNLFVEGTYNDGQGTSYTGQFKNDNHGFKIYDGQGAETSARFMGRITKGQWENGKLIGKGLEIYPNGYYMEALFKDYSHTDEKYFNNQNIQITKEEFNAKVIYQFCAEGNCYNGIGLCEANYSKTIFVGNWVNGKKEGFVAEFTSADNYYYGIWKADTLFKKITDKEAEIYLTTNARRFLNLLGRNKILAAATSLIKNCTTETCTSGDCKNGYGAWENCKGATYTGNYANGKYNGKGKLTSENGDVYDGDWVNNVKQGKGKYTWSDGSYYEGDFVNGRIEGKGKNTLANGNVYVGDFVNGTREGKGKFTWSNGDIYNGDWVNNTMQGKGEMTWQKKEYYKGDWVNGVRHGKGRSLDTEGRIREGDWLNGKFVITEAQRQINEDAKYKISVLEKTIFETRISLGNMVGPSDPKEKAKYDKVRENLEDGINSALKLIQELSKQIIE